MSRRTYKTDVYNGFWIAYYENDPTRLSPGKTQDDALDNLFTRDFPEDYIFEHNRFLASDESPWLCRHNNHVGVLGSGGSPCEAYKACKESLTTTWHYNRRRKLFRRMLALAKADANRFFDEHSAEKHYQETKAFIKDWEDGKIGVIKK